MATWIAVMAGTSDCFYLVCDPERPRLVIVNLTNVDHIPETRLQEDKVKGATSLPDPKVRDQWRQKVDEEPGGVSIE